MDDAERVRRVREVLERQAVWARNYHKGGYRNARLEVIWHVRKALGDIDDEGNYTEGAIE
jgi:hypothetical protein